MKKSLMTICALLLSAPSFADDTEASAPKEGKWTFGIGIVGLSMPHYAGSDQTRGLLLPFPYINYKSEKVTIDRNGIKRKLWDSENFDLVFSGGGSIRVNSDDNKAREGMPDLGWAGSVGPALNWYLSQDKSLYMQTAIRKAFVIDDGIDGLGWQGETSLNWASQKTKFSSYGQKFYVAKVRLRYNTSKFNDYFYGVDAQYATNTRTAYEADGGYSGAQVLLGMNFVGESYRAGFFARYSNLSGAAYDDSPLVLQDDNFSFGFSYAWLFD